VLILFCRQVFSWAY